MTDLPFGEPLTGPTVNVAKKRCVHRWDWVVWTSEYQCARCGKVRDETVRRRNRNNRQRGASFERSVAKQLGGRRTGPLGGRDDVMVGAFAAIQTKKDGSLSLNKAREYLDDLTTSHPTKVPLVIHARPGPKPDPVVILPLRVWVELHGQEGTE